MKIIIVNYHYIREQGPGDGIFPLTPLDFRLQIDEIGKKFEFISPSCLKTIIKSGIYSDKNYCLLTFDDALAEQVIALDILSSKSIPFCCFACTQPITERKVLSVHKLHQIISEIEDDEIFSLINEIVPLSEIKYDEKKLKLEYRYDKPKRRRLKYLLNFVLSFDDKQKVIDYLFSQICPNELVFSDKLYMDVGVLTDLAARGMLGTHTKSHLPLSHLSETELSEEIIGSKLELERITSSKISTISYPFGGPNAVSKNVADFCLNNGFDFGLTMNRGFNFQEELRTPLLLKRFDTNDVPGGKSYG